jgi:MFS family permease
MNRPTKYRWVVCGLLFALVALSYIDRLIIGILKKPIGEQLGWSEVDYGNIAAGFSFAYAFGYLFAGRAIDWLRVKRGLPIFMFVWSLAVASHGLISFIGKDEMLRMKYPWFSFTEMGFAWMTLMMPMTAAGFVFARIILGLAEGANFPAAIRTVAEWFPVKERAYATGLFNSGTNIGAVLCPLVVPWIYIHLGWPLTFYLTGAGGILWLSAWWFLYDEPEKQRWMNKNELDYIRSGQPQTTEKAVKIPWLSLFKYRSVWAYVIASILAGPAWGFYQFFVPDFLDKKFSSPTITLNDFEQFPLLVSQLNNSTNPVSIYIRDSLSPETKTALSQYQPNHDALELQAALVADLNHLIHGPSWYDAERFQGAKLRSGTKDLASKKLENKKLNQFNRMLLEDACPTSIKRMLSLQAIGYWTGAFFALTAIGGIGGGWLAGRLIGRGWTLNAARKLTLLLCALCVLPVFYAPFAPTVLTAVLIVGLAGAAHQGWSANLFSVVSDTMPKEVISSVIGLGGFVCYFTGGFVNGLTGVILQKTGTYVAVFGYFSGMYVLSIIAIQLLVPKIKPELTK